MAFYANEWVDRDGYGGAFGTMAGMSFACLALGIPLYIWGKSIRGRSLIWSIMKPIAWNEDHEVGE